MVKQEMIFPGQTILICYGKLQTETETIFGFEIWTVTWLSKVTNREAFLFWSYLQIITWCVPFWSLNVMQLYCVMDVQCMHIIKQNQTKVVVAKKMGLDKLKCFSGYIEICLATFWNYRKESEHIKINLHMLHIFRVFILSQILTVMFRAQKSNDKSYVHRRH